MWKILRTVKLRKNFPPFFFFLETNIKPTAKVKKREKKSCFEDSNFSVFFSLQEKIVN